MKGITEIRWHGRAGQGTVSAAKILADTVLAAGDYVQTFPEYYPGREGVSVGGKLEHIVELTLANAVRGDLTRYNRSIKGSTSGSRRRERIMYDFYKDLIAKNDSKIVLLIMDGFGGMPREEAGVENALIENRKEGIMYETSKN